MVDDIEKLAVLYHKIKQHCATAEEKNKFDLAIKTSCLNESVLMALIFEKEKRIND